MTSVSIHEAKTHLSKLIANVEKFNETIIICRHGHAVAELMPVHQGIRTQTDSVLKKIKIHDDLTKPTIGEWENA